MSILPPLFRLSASRALFCVAIALASFVTGDAGARTLAEIKQLGVVSMCANDNALPYSSKDPQTPGFQVEIGHAVADALGVSLTVEWILPQRRANVVNCDMLFDKVLDRDISDPRMRLTRPYQRSGVALGLRRDAAPIDNMDDLQKGQKIGVMVNSYASMTLGKAGKSTSPYAFQSDMFEDLRSGELYGVALSVASISYYSRLHPEMGLQLLHAFDGVPNLTWEIAAGLRNADDAFVDAVNSVLDSFIANGTLARIYARYGIEHRINALPDRHHDGTHHMRNVAALAAERSR